MERLQKIIAEAGYTSRRDAEKLILAGKVFVNGKKITELGTKANSSDIIIVNGVSLTKKEKQYFLLNKPRGVITSVKDEHNRKTVVDFIKTETRIYPVGRLDYNTTGLIILTNDGELANILMHPKNGVPKKYVAKLNKCMAITDFKRLLAGITLDGIKCTPTRAKLKENDTDKDYAIVEITITEGRNHIIKRLFQELGYLVDKLTRVEYGFFTLEKLKSGEYRTLSIKEVKKLYDYKN